MSKGDFEYGVSDAPPPPEPEALLFVVLVNHAWT